MNGTAFIAIFPIFFICMWLLVGLMLGAWSGWYALQDRFPDRDEEPVDSLHFRSGLLGKGSLWNPWGNVQYKGCLRFDICRSGLRVAVWPIFGLNCRPFLIPWARIAIDARRILFVQYYRLSFGDPNLSALTIRRRAFLRIRESGFLPPSVGNFD